MIDHLASGGVGPRECPTPGACSCVAADARHVPMLITDAARDVLTERRRQVESNGYTLTHDDEYTCGELAIAAVSYACQALVAVRLIENGGHTAGEVDAAVRSCSPPAAWPFLAEQWEPVSRRQSLVKAGALILAEIERLDRAEGRRR